MKKKVSIIFIIICVGFISCVGGVSCFLNDKVVSQLENRTLATSPLYTQEKLISGEYFNEYENYSLDQMVGRDRFVNLLNTSKVIEGKKEINNIIIGADGVLLKRGNYDSIEEKVSQGNSESVANSISKIKETVDGYGGETIYMHVMHQSEFYKDKLPTCYQSLSNNFDKYNEALLTDVSKTGAKVVNCNPVLMKHKNEYLYYKTDHHWTPKGAYYAYRELLNAINENEKLDKYDDMDIVRSNKTFLGSLSSQIGTTYFQNGDHFEYAVSKNMPNYSRRTSRTNKKQEANNDKLFQDNGTIYSKYGDIEQTDYAQDTFYTSQINKKNILIIGYSYKEALIPYALNNFNKVMTLDPRKYNGNINDYIKVAKADYVVVLRDDLWDGNEENVATIE